MLRVNFGRRVFAPSLAATVPVFAGIALLAVLGTWQLDRAAAQRAQLAAYARDAPTVALPPASTAPARYTRVAVSGHYLRERQFLLDNMTHAGVAGYRVLTPFATDRGEIVLVDRGWLALGASRASLPAVGVGVETRRVTGRLDTLPRPGIELADARDDGTWPRVVSFPKLADLARALGAPLYPQLVLLDAAEPDGYVRDWRPGGLPPERHIGYAVQWYALALTLLALYLIASLKSRA